MIQALKLPSTDATPVQAMLASEDKVHNVIIIGSGPAGYTAAIYAARAQLSPLVFEGALDAGGALMTTTEVENFPGFAEGIQGPLLMANMRNQAERFGAKLIADDVISVDLLSDIKIVQDSDGVIHKAKTVILATGSAYRKLGIEDEPTYSGQGVSWCATCDGFFYRGKNIAVVGGGDSAVQEAIYLTRFADKVTLVHRRNELRASKIMAHRALTNPKIDFKWDSEIVGLGGNQKLQFITLKNTKTGAISQLQVEGLFEAIGHEPRSALFLGQVDVDDEGYVKVAGDSTRTNLDGVFACGDLVDRNYRQAITAAGTGCRAAIDAESYLLDH